MSSTTTDSLPPRNPKIKAIFFDFMGTCLDWHTPIVTILPQSIPSSTRSSLAIEWRHDYFDYNVARLSSGLPPEDIDVSMRSTLHALLTKPEHTQWKDHFTPDDIERGVTAWHEMPAWPDVRPVLENLKAQGYELFVFANGTTRLQLDLVRSSGLRGLFKMLFSSQLLEYIKPDPRSYERVCESMRIKAEEGVMVACHAYDNRGGRGVGMKTVYVYRWTDDVNENMDVVRGENDEFIREGGFEGLVEAIGAL